MKTVSLAFLVAILLVAHGASGADWTLINSPNANNQANELHGVSAAADNDAWAVGIVITGFSTTPLIEHWNGTAWSIVANPGTTVGGLSGVAVVSSNDIWAVGTGLTGDEDATLTLHWNGAAWSLVPSPNVGPEVDNRLAAVTAIASDDVWAVGTQQSTSLTAPHTLTLHWDGSAWTIVPSADTSQTTANHLL